MIDRWLLNLQSRLWDGRLWRFGNALADVRYWIWRARGGKW